MKRLCITFNDDTPQEVIDLIAEGITILTDLADVTAVQVYEDTDEEAGDA